jgi:hypothetical protein
MLIILCCIVCLDVVRVMAGELWRQGGSSQVEVMILNTLRCRARSEMAPVAGSALVGGPEAWGPLGRASASLQQLVPDMLNVLHKLGPWKNIR